MKKPTIGKIQKQLWEHCKRIIRSRYINKNGTWNCFTCGRLINEPAKAQTGHFIANSISGAYLRYDLRNLRIQCYNCNINCGGNGAMYYKRLVEENGQEFVDQLFKDKEKTVKAYDHYLFLLEEYKKL